MKNLINKDGSMEVHEEFFIPNSNKRLKVVGTYSDDWMKDTFKKSAWQCTDTVKNLDTGKLTEIKRQQLYNKKPYIK